MILISKEDQDHPQKEVEQMKILMLIFLMHILNNSNKIIIILKILYLLIQSNLVNLLQELLQHLLIAMPIQIFLVI